MGLLDKLIVKITGDASELNSTLDKNASKTSAWSGKVAGFIKGAFAIGAIVAFLSKVKDASEALSDKFEAAVAGAKGALHEFFIMISTGDFSKFFANLDEGYKKAKKLAEAKDAFKDTRSYAEFKISELEGESAQLQTIIKDHNLVRGLREKAAADAKRIEQEILKMKKAVAQEAFDLEAQEWENKNKMSVESAKELYEKVAKIDKGYLAEMEAAYEASIKERGKAFFMSDQFAHRMPFIDLIEGKNKPKDFSQFEEGKLASDYYYKYKKLMLGGDTDLIPKLFGALKEKQQADRRATEEYNGILRITNELLKQQADIVTTIPVSPAIMQAIGMVGGTMPKFNSFGGSPVADVAGASSKEIIPEMTDAQKNWTEGWKQAANQAVDFISETFIDMFARIGSGDFKGFGADLLKGFGNLLANLGKMLVSLGTTMLLTLTLLKAPSIPTAIAAIALGATAMAIGGAIIGMAGSGASSLASGGGSASGGGGINSSTANLKVVIDGKIQGKDIVFIMRRYMESER